MKAKILMAVSTALLTASLALAQQPKTMWYRGYFDGKVTVRQDPSYGYYYQPSPNPAYPLHEEAYGQPVPCANCGHQHWPGQSRCATCGRDCPEGGTGVRDNVVYRQQPLPGIYYYQEQPHYTWPAPYRLNGIFHKYDRRWDEVPMQYR